MRRQTIKVPIAIEHSIISIQKSVAEEPGKAFGIVVEYINENYPQRVSLSDLARISGLSVSRLAHGFKERTGTTPKEYLTLIRIHHAKQCLIHSELPCCKVGKEVGYGTQSYFTRRFKNLVGMTPRQYRILSRSEKLLQNESQPPVALAE